MSTAVVVPQMGLEITEARVLEVLVEVGDHVRKDTALIEMETDKAMTEIVAPADGFVVSIEVSPGDKVEVGAVLARLGESPDDASGGPDETSSADAQGEADGQGEAVAATGGDLEPGAASEAGMPPSGSEAGDLTRIEPAPNAASDRSSDPARIRAAPIARRAAAKLGIDLASVQGSGSRGRITLRDVEAVAEAPAAEPAADAAGSAPTAAGGSATQPQGPALALTSLRRAIARRMTQSQLIPQYKLERDIDATHLLAQKDAIVAGASGSARISVNDLLLQAVAEMVLRHPALATIFVDEQEPSLSYHPAVGVGLAVTTDRGLVVPVIEDVPEHGLTEIAARRQELVAAARAGRLTLEQLSGGAISLSNLGGFGIDRFTAMLNPGESAIVAVGRTTERVVPRGRGTAVIPILTLTMSFDHRVVDGAVGAAALAELAELLEGGMAWRP